ncbi:phospholipase D family protein [Sulfitobacter sp. JL08]|uniref:phospholipase D family protein n=1 Tax=Sulfitobacter sp. JL08 TaxID=2070369 RepID=UPI0013B46D34|nr:phospholipase D family protein [Sulfitobacter sp. JL08]
MSGNQVVLAPLGNGNDALGARLRMIEQAEASIDLKTFLIKPDTAGALIWLALYDAAERGVKIRLLYDDVFTSARDEEIATLDAHPNVEIRAFNPLSRNSTLAVNFLLDFRRVNRRMHNKAFIVDGALAIVGGRNIADEYYQIETESEFADFDLFVAGPPVEQISDAFDLFWNDEWAVPVESFTRGDSTLLSEAVTVLRAVPDAPASKVYRGAVNSQYLRDLREGMKPSYRGAAYVVTDDPEKLRRPPGQGPFKVGNAFYNTLLSAKREVLIVTPYFVPEDYGADIFERLVSRGLRVRIITNSLASTNHAYVHGSYAKYRNRLLESGIEFIEVRADAPLIAEGSRTPLVLHSKLAIIDAERLFVSSTNIDPRSIRQNTEIGMIIESPQLASDMLNQWNAEVGDYVFDVVAGPGGEPIWRYEGAGISEIYYDEPNAGFVRKLIARLTGWLPIEQQL